MSTLLSKLKVKETTGQGCKLTSCFLLQGCFELIMSQYSNCNDTKLNH